MPQGPAHEDCLPPRLTHTQLRAPLQPADSMTMLRPGKVQQLQMQPRTPVQAKHQQQQQQQPAGAELLVRVVLHQANNITSCA